MRTLLRNLWLAARSAMQRPAFTFVAVLTLALGIGANSAIFSVIDAVLLEPLPYPKPERLATLRSNVSVLDLEDIRAHSRLIAHIGGVTTYPLDFTGAGEPVQVETGIVDAGIFDALGVQAAIGRTLTPSDDRLGGERLVVLSDRFWRRYFQGQPEAIGRTITLSGNAYTVVGVMPPDFDMPESSPDLWASVRVVYPVGATHRGVHFLRPVVRLADGATFDQLQAELTGIAALLAEKDPGENRNRAITLMPLHERLVGDTRPALLVLFGAVGLVLLIACANFANLMLTRAAERHHEIAVRSALGASRVRLVGEILTESTLYALAGGLAGLVLAAWGVDVLVAIRPDDIRQLQQIGVDGRVLAFTASVALLTGVLSGLVPAIAATRPGALEALREGGRGIAGAVRHRIRSVLVVVEVALAVVLLVGSGLLIHSFWKLRSVEPGFDTENLLTMRIDLPESRYEEIPAQTRFREQVIDRIDAVPGLRASMVSEIPLSGDALTHNVAIEGRDMGQPGDEPELNSRSVGPDYFGVMGIPILAGRALGPEDGSEAPLAGVVNERFVREYFPEGNAVGARIRWARMEGPPQWITIVGVAGDVRHFGLDREEQPAVYTPYVQSLQNWKRWQVLVVRGAGDPASVVSAVKRQVWSLDPELAITKIRTMSEVSAESVAKRRFTMALLGLFAAVALVLAAMGIYGVMMFSVTQRTHEIGVRMALGARAGDVVRMVVRQGVGMAVLGAALGVAGAFTLTRLMESLLFGVTATDPATFAAAVSVLVGVALLACYVPARRASRVDPMRALRCE